MMKRRDALAGLAGLAMLPHAFGQAATKAAAGPTVADAVVRASRLRMLTDRITKAVAQRTLSVLPERADRLQASSVADIQTALDELARVNSSPESKALLAQADKVLREFVAKASKGPFDNARLSKLADEADDVVIAKLEELVKAYQAEAKVAEARQVGQAGRLRLLTQHLPVHYFLTLAGIEAEPNRKEITRARGEFGSLLSELEAASLNTEPIRENLKLVRQQWLFMDLGLAATARSDTLQRDVATTSERILEVLDTLAGQYEGLMRAAALKR